MKFHIYSDYQYVDGDEDKIGQFVNLTVDLSKGADSVYGGYIDYTEINGESKRSYIMGPYPNPSSNRIYIGSGYNNDGDNEYDTIIQGMSDVMFIVLISIAGIVILVGFMLIYCFCCYKKRTSISSSRNTTYEPGVTMTASNTRTKASNSKTKTSGHRGGSTYSSVAVSRTRPHYDDETRRGNTRATYSAGHSGGG